jgi:hypothetical protein
MNSTVEDGSHMSHVVGRKDWIEQLALPPMEIAW